MILEPRDNKWLKSRFKYIKDYYFPDVSIINHLVVKFGRPCTTRLGSIKKGRRQENFNSIITINGHFRDPAIPTFVVDAVLAHEFMHYTHGFASPHKQAFLHPHKGGVVDGGLRERGLTDILKAEKVWIKDNWASYLKTHHQPQKKSIFSIIFK